MGVFLKNLDQVRAVNWSKSWLWDLKFIPGPDGFSDWFPATAVEINEFALDPHNFAGGNSTFEIPKNTTLFDLKITFTDDIYLHVEKWVKSWVNDEIFANGTTQTLREAVKKIIIVKLANEKSDPKPVEEQIFWVFPKGSLYYSGNSEAGIHSNVLDFVIAGKE